MATKRKPLKRVIKRRAPDASEKHLLNQLKEKINATMSKAFLAKEHAKTAREKNQYQKIIAESRKKLKKLL